MIEARSTRGTALQLGEEARSPMEPAQKANAGRARLRLVAAENSVRFPLEGSQSNSPDLPDNHWTPRMPTRSPPSPATSRRTQEGAGRQKQLPSRPTQPDGQSAQGRMHLRRCGGSTRTNRIHQAAPEIKQI